jgi:hypothetical protein
MPIESANSASVMPILWRWRESLSPVNTSGVRPVPWQFVHFFVRMFINCASVVLTVENVNQRL